MDKKSIIKALYWNIEELSGSFIPQGVEYQKAVEHKNKAEAALLELLPDGSYKVFENFMNAMSDIEIWGVHERSNGWWVI